MDSNQLEEVRQWLRGWLKGDVEGYEPMDETYDFVDQSIDQIDEGRFVLETFKNYPETLHDSYLKDEISSVILTCLGDCGVN
jgi:hypothetical protein